MSHLHVQRVSLGCNAPRCIISRSCDTCFKDLRCDRTLRMILIASSSLIYSQIHRLPERVNSCKLQPTSTSPQISASFLIDFAAVSDGEYDIAQSTTVHWKRFNYELKLLVSAQVHSFEEVWARNKSFRIVSVLDVWTEYGHIMCVVVRPPINHQTKTNCLTARAVNFLQEQAPNTKFSFVVFGWHVKDVKQNAYQRVIFRF